MPACPSAPAGDAPVRPGGRPSPKGDAEAHLPAQDEALTTVLTTMPRWQDAVADQARIDVQDRPKRRLSGGDMDAEVLALKPRTTRAAEQT